MGGPEPLVLSSERDGAGPDQRGPPRAGGLFQDPQWCPSRGCLTGPLGSSPELVLFSFGFSVSLAGRVTCNKTWILPQDGDEENETQWDLKWVIRILQAHSIPSGTLW